MAPRCLFDRNFSVLIESYCHTAALCSHTHTYTCKGQSGCGLVVMICRTNVLCWQNLWVLITLCKRDILFLLCCSRSLCPSLLVFMKYESKELLNAMLWDRWKVKSVRKFENSKGEEIVGINDRGQCGMSLSVWLCSWFFYRENTHKMDSSVIFYSPFLFFYGTGNLIFWKLSTHLFSMQQNLMVTTTFNHKKTLLHYIHNLKPYEFFNAPI